MSTRIARFQMITAMTIFGTIGLFVRWIPLPSSVIALARGCIGMLFLLFVMAVKKTPISWQALRKNLFWLLISGALLGFNWILLFESYRYTSVATGTLCYYMAPILIILASPVHFDEVSGSLLQVMSRLQVFWMAKRFRNEDLLKPKARRGAALLAAGGPGKAEPAHAMMKRLLHCMGASDESIIHCKNTDRIPVAENQSVREQIIALAEQING